MKRIMTADPKHSPVNIEGDYLIDNTVDVKNQLFPYCIVWTPIPLLTWLFPFIGHMGIANSNGVIYDFAGSYTIGERHLAFGDPTKYWQLKPELADNGRVGYDKGIEEGCTFYRNRVHNLICDNCHSHVAKCLNVMNYNNTNRWNMVRLAVLLLVYGKYTSLGGFLKTWLPFAFMVAMFVILSKFL